MPQPIAYNTGSQTSGSLKLNGIEYAISSSIVSGSNGQRWFTSVNPGNGIVLVTNSFTQSYSTYQNSTPLFYTASALTATAITGAINGLPDRFGLPRFTDTASAFAWVANSRKYFMMNYEYPQIVTDNLVFLTDAKFLASYPTTQSTWYDISGNNNIFGLFNGPSFNPNGYITTDGVNDFLSSTNPQSISNISGSDPFTFSALFKLTQYANQQASDVNNYSSLLMKGAYNPSFGISLWYDLPSGGVFTRARTYSGVRNLSLPSTASGYGNPTQTSNTNFALNRWYQVDFTSEFSGTTYTFKTYVNGNLDVTSTSTLSTYPVAFQNNSNLTLATSPIGGNGVIAPINISKGVVYKKSLSQAEVNQNYYSGPIATDGLVFALDAGNLVSYESSSLTAYSLTGSNSGSLTNGTSYSSANGGVFVFDGVDDSISVPDNAALDFTGSVNLTSEVWINFNLYKDISFVNAKGDGGGQATAYNYFFIGTNTSFYFRVSDGTTTQNSPLITKANLPEGTWGHVVAVLDTTVIRIYLNGVEIGTSTTRTINPKANNNPLYISGTTYSLNGKIGISRIYNRALTAAEVQQNFNAQRSRFGI